MNVVMSFYHNHFYNLIKTNNLYDCCVQFYRAIDKQFCLYIYTYAHICKSMFYLKGIFYSLYEIPQQIVLYGIPRNSGHVKYGLKIPVQSQHYAP